jgi:hypothetical protein
MITRWRKIDPDASHRLGQELAPPVEVRPASATHWIVKHKAGVEMYFTAEIDAIRLGRSVARMSRVDLLLSDRRGTERREKFSPGWGWRVLTRFFFRETNRSS